MLTQSALRGAASTHSFFKLEKIATGIGMDSAFLVPRMKSLTPITTKIYADGGDM